MSTRHRSARKYAHFLESLESRILMTTFNLHQGDNLQTFINNAALGDTLILDAGASFIGSFTLPNKTTGTGTITIQSSSLASLPGGVRVGPAQASLMPKIISPGLNQSAILTAASAHDYQFLGIEFAPQTNTAIVGDLIRLGDGSAAQNSLTLVPKNLTFDRCYIHGLPAADYKRGIALNSSDTSITNCYISEFHDRNVDSQAIGGWNGPGNYTITNNYLEASCENIIFGGSDASIPNLVPTNITITGNYFTKQASWNPLDPSYAGITYSVKNIFELKNARDVLVDKNIFENVWAGAQVGFAILLKAVNQGGGNPWAACENITFTNNVIRHANNALNILTSDNGQAVHNLTIANNLFYDIGAPLYGGSGIGFQIIRGSVVGSDVKFEHNTLFGTLNFLAVGDTAPVLSSGFIFRNNLVTHGTYGAKGPGFGVGTPTLNAFLPGYIFTGNGIIGGSSANYPAGNLFTASISTASFFDYPNNKFYLNTNSPFYHQATDGTDMGIDWNNLAPEFLGTSTPSVSISATDATASETLPNNGVFTVSRTGPTTSALTVNISKSGTATNATDYNSIGTSVTIPIGASSATITLTPIDDAIVEGDETAIITLATGTGYNIGSPNAATVTITDNDLPSITISATDATASETLPNNGVFTVTRTGPTTAAITVNFTKSGTAINTTDYSTLGTTVTIPIGASSATVTVTPVDDALVEGTETVILTLASGTGYSVGSPSNATVNITDNDATFSNASDSFSYTSGAGLNGQGSAGSGWAGPWTAAATTKIAASSLTPPVNVATSGGSVSLTASGGGASTRNISSTLNASSTVWTSVLIKADLLNGPGPWSGGIVVGNTQIEYHAIADGTWHWNLYSVDSSWYGSHWNSASNPTVTSGTTYWLVLEQIFNGGSDTVYAWINPTPGSTAPSTATAFETKTGVNAGGTLSNINFTSSYYSLPGFDELRIGSTFASVAPVGSTPPTAPTNLVATPGTSSITLNWTDNSGTNETGFHVWRSTDNTNWGSVYGSTGQNVATFTDNAPTAGVGYYYKVTAFNGAGDSSAATMSCAIATVIAYDGFNYTPGTGANWNGQSGGVGFSSAWTVSNTTSSAVVSGSIPYSSGTHALLETGNSVSLHIEGSTATRTVNTTFGTDDTSLWVGFVINQHITGGTGVLQSSLWIGNDVNNHIELGSPWNGFYDGQGYVGGNRLYWSGTGVAPTDGVNTFLVYRVDFGHQAGNTSPDKILLWVNPTPGIQPSDASATTTWTLPTGTYFAFTDSKIALMNGSYWNQTKFDEVRLGVSYISVAPDPIVAASVGPRALPVPALHAVSSAAIKHITTLTLPSAAAISAPDNATEIAPPIAIPDYHFQGNSGKKDPNNPDADENDDNNDGLLLI